MNLSKEIEIEDLYNNFRKPLLKFISYRVADIYSAEEILNDVFLKASMSLGSLKEKTKIKSWLYKIASNMIIDYYRRKKENYTDIYEGKFSFEDDMDTIYNELDCCIEKFLYKLPKQYSDPLRAIYLDELTQKEYAEQNNLNLSTVKSQVKRGKESMKNFFEQCCTFEKDHLDNIIEFVPIEADKNKLLK
ncbi:MAG: sigma-70 family RNA polymerase sigma factor [Sulfurovaceae bacterium]|nr:sigma-70 family RNA polymerase sigma factor [Sulfurovaceae bacterium]